MASGNFEDDAEATVSINEYIESMDAEELEADLVLGGDEGDECTYPKGYMKRQAIFSCITCNPEGNAGVCTACCLSCHDGHELLELWTKRNFRCDCGNSKFGAFGCKLLPSKDVENSENSYNHNFKGLYCTCDQPYPDPNVEEQVEMIQCCICEDWFHEEHLTLKALDSVGSQIPRDKEGEHLTLKPLDSVGSQIPRDEEGVHLTLKPLDSVGSQTPRDEEGVHLTLKPLDSVSSQTPRDEEGEHLTLKPLDSVTSQMPRDEEGEHLTLKPLDSVTSQMPRDEEGEHLTLKPLDSVNNQMPKDEEGEHLTLKPLDNVSSQIPRDEEGEHLTLKALDSVGSQMPGDDEGKHLTLKPLDSVNSQIPRDEGEHLTLKPLDSVGSQMPRDEEGEPIYEDFICPNCSPVCSFLSLYPEKLWVAAQVDSTGSTTKLNKSPTDSEPDQPEKINDSEPIPPTGCAIAKGLNLCPEFEKKPLFLTKNWRNILCKCDNCLEMYNKRKVSYLVDAEDTIVEYEKKAKEKRTEKMEKQEGEALNLLNNLDHVAKVEILHGIKDFKEEFRGLLESAGPSKTITAADVEQMFSNLKKKRKRMD